MAVLAAVRASESRPRPARRRACACRGAAGRRPGGPAGGPLARAARPVAGTARPGRHRAPPRQPAAGAAHPDRRARGHRRGAGGRAGGLATGVLDHRRGIARFPGPGRWRRHGRRHAERARDRGYGRPHDAAEPRDHPPPRRRDGHARADDPAPGRGPHPDPGAGHRLGRGAAGDHRPDRAAELPGRGQPHVGPGGAAGPRPGDLSERRRAGRLLRAGAARSGHRRPACRQPADLRPERPAGGELPLQPAGRRGLRTLYGRKHRLALCDRARRRGDLGAGDPEPHPRRHRHHHRPLHSRGVRRGSRSCCAPARSRPRSAFSNSARSGRSWARTRSRPAGSPQRSR